MPKQRPIKDKVKSKSILSYFSNNAVNRSLISCPACGQSVLKHKINQHLDDECSSRSDIGPQNIQDGEVKIEATQVVTVKNVGNCDSSGSLPNTPTKNIRNDGVSFSCDTFIKKQKLCSTAYKIEESVGSPLKHNEASTSSPVKACLLENAFFSNSSQSSISSTQNRSSSTIDYDIQINEVNKDKSPLKETFSNEDSQSESISSSQNSSQGVKSQPYYLGNFLLILNAVLSDSEDSLLFNDEDKTVINKFHALTDQGKQLYVRLFQRKPKWIKMEKIKYSEISENLTDVINELVNNNFLLSDSLLTDLPTVLKLLNPSDLKELAKTFRLVTTKNQKEFMINEILKYSKRQRLIFSSSASNTEQIILKKARSLLTSSVKINNDYRSIFQRAIMLFSLTNYSPDNDDEVSGNSQLLTILFVNMKKLVFPLYEVRREHKLFLCRDDVLQYIEAREIEGDIILLMELRKFEEALESYKKSKEIYELQKNYFFAEKFIQMPEFLKRYTVGAVYVRCLSYGVDILQRLKMYSEAVEQLNQLLEQKNYHQDWRGRWAERLALNFEQHLKLPEEALETIFQGLSDPWIRSGHNLALILRGERIMKSKKTKITKEHLKNMALMPLPKIPEVFIQGCRLPNNKSGQKSYFINLGSLNEDEEHTICNVEEFARNHYETKGFIEGIHGESGTPCSIFGLLFWDIIYCPDIPDVFRGPYQALPLDLNTDNFYNARRLIIDEQLNWIQNATHDEIIAKMLEAWVDHENELSLVHWSIFRDFFHLQTLVECIHPKIISAICERYAKDYRHCRSGFPDLIVWNPSEKRFKVVEVKGPNDRLSTKQITWMNFLLSLGVDAEVCHVSEIGAKKLRQVSADKD